MSKFLTIFVITFKRNAFTTKNERYEKVTFNKNKNLHFRRTLRIVHRVLFLRHVLYLLLCQHG